MKKVEFELADGLEFSISVGDTAAQSAINPIGITTPILTGVTGDVGIIGNAEEES
jgi:hypothetical protein